MRLPITDVRNLERGQIIRNDYGRPCTVLSVERSPDAMHWRIWNDDGHKPLFIVPNGARCTIHGTHNHELVEPYRYRSACSGCDLLVDTLVAS